MQNAKQEFEFSSFKLASDRLSISFVYTIIFNGNNKETFEENILLPNPIPVNIPNKIIKQILFSLHLIIGISYYKMYYSSIIHIKSGSLNRKQADFWNIVYTKGLGEFFYRNRVDFRKLIDFPYDKDQISTSVPFKRSNRSLVGIGGGKDSLVSFELLQKAGKSILPLVIESNHSYPLIDQMLSYFEISSLRIKRIIDKKLFEKNKENTVFNGHIPVSAINAFVGVLVCIIYDYQYFIVSNERSANFGNVEYFGLSINHQWSKSIEFENLFREYVHDFITSGVTYFSLLRSLSEFAIVKLFSSYAKYFPFFSSCNANYKIDKAIQHKGKWCNTCPKCAFVFCMLSAFLSKKKVIEIFGKNLFSDSSLITVYRQLWGKEDVKPFECVGTSDEVKAAFYLIHQKGEYKNDVIMSLFEREELLLIREPETLLSTILKRDDMSSIPKEFKSIISQLQI